MSIALVFHNYILKIHTKTHLPAKTAVLTNFAAADVTASHCQHLAEEHSGPLQYTTNHRFFFKKLGIHLGLLFSISLLWNKFMIGNWYIT